MSKAKCFWKGIARLDGQLQAQAAGLIRILANRLVTQAEAEAVGVVDMDSIMEA